MKLADLYPVVVTLILIGMVLGIGIFVLSSVEDNIDSTTAGSYANVTADFGASNITSVTLNVSSALRDGSCGTITSIRNGTVGQLINTGNYSQAGCVVTNTTDTFATEDWLIDYPFTYSTDTVASTAVNNTIAGMGDFADWIAIIVVVIAAAIVLGIVLSSFGRKNPGV